MEKRAEESIIRINIPATEMLETTSFSFSETNEISRTMVMIYARWVEGEKPENMQYRVKGSIVMMPAIFLDLPVMRHFWKNVRK